MPRFLLFLIFGLSLSKECCGGLLSSSLGGGGSAGAAATSSSTTATSTTNPVSFSSSTTTSDGSLWTPSYQSTFKAYIIINCLTEQLLTFTPGSRSVTVAAPNCHFINQLFPTFTVDPITGAMNLVTSDGRWLHGYNALLILIPTLAYTSNTLQEEAGSYTSTVISQTVESVPMRSTDWINNIQITPVNPSISAGQCGPNLTNVALGLSNTMQNTFTNLTTIPNPSTMNISNALANQTQAISVSVPPGLCKYQVDLNLIQNSLNVDTILPGSNSLLKQLGIGQQEINAGKSILSILGLKILLSESQDEYICSTMSAGYRVVLHSGAINDPFPDDIGYFVPMGFASSLSSYQNTFYKSGWPHDNCQSHLPDGETYTIEGCYRHCYQELMISECGCADPRYDIPEGAAYCNTSRSEAFIKTVSINEMNKLYTTVEVYLRSISATEYVETPYYGYSGNRDIRIIGTNAFLGVT
uniref:Uncharacterized protein n=1 Tax=Romanomermis culicivorax TaxID=13658 RepID=A0A915JPL8_ROMCU